MALAALIPNLASLGIPRALVFTEGTGCSFGAGRSAEAARWRERPSCPAEQWQCPAVTKPSGLREHEQDRAVMGVVLDMVPSM